MATTNPPGQAGPVAPPNWAFRCQVCKGEHVYPQDTVKEFIFRGWPACCGMPMTALGMTRRGVTHPKSAGVPES